MLAEAFGGHVSAYYPSYSDAPLARVHYIIGVTPAHHLDPDLPSLERAIAELARTWSDDFEAVVRRRAQPDEAAAILAVWSDAFPPGYRDRYGAAEALADLAAIERLGADAPIAIRAFRHASDSPRSFRFKLYRASEPIALADVLPILDNMGLKALVRGGLRAGAASAREGGRRKVWIHEFVLDDPRGERLSFDGDRGRRSRTPFLAVWVGQAENDGFNRLVLELGVAWREAALIRALARYRQQSGLDPSQAVQQQALSDHPEVAALILELFPPRFDPALGGRRRRARAEAEALWRADRGGAAGGGEPRRRPGAAAPGGPGPARSSAPTTTSPAPTASPSPTSASRSPAASWPTCPTPKPFREIFVASPQVEGVHLRFGPVARGGLRWSDRRDDFRTEVLGLVKAQQVKNAVIVPVGSKGGFYPKRLPRGGPPDAVRAEAVARLHAPSCSASSTSPTTSTPTGEVVHPADVVVCDGDDPYLVVAADKGTATFSDIANGVAEAYGFWLGDAFASGGSAGYDHKAMGITARGAWEGGQAPLPRDRQGHPDRAVHRASASATCRATCSATACCCRRQTRLVAAFDHRHIFLDPDPDPAPVWAERKRLFDLPTLVLGRLRRGR